MVEVSVVDAGVFGGGAALLADLIMLEPVAGMIVD